jgi:malate synthase
MTMYVGRADLKVAQVLAAFVEDEVLPQLDLDAAAFWSGVASIFDRFTGENRQLLAVREELQAKIDAWHDEHRIREHDPQAYEAFLRRIGYLVDEPAPFQITTTMVDDELARQAGPQLVVPVLNPRFLLNAVNARWGSLYDALYGTDAIARSGAETEGYDAERGAEVIQRAKAFLDQATPLESGKHADVEGWRVEGRALSPALADPSAFVGYRGDPANPSAILLRHNGLHIELVINRNHPIGCNDPAGLADVILESALSTIVDLEDSIAAVDAEDKTAAYANWLGVMRGDLTATFEKDGRTRHREMAEDRRYLTPQGDLLVMPGRSVLLIRNVGHLMTTSAVRLADGSQAFEGILDAILTSLIALYDLRGLGQRRNSRAGSIYIVKPKMHGPAEVDFASRLFGAVEDLLGLPRNTVKMGVMDEERRTSVNLAACIAAAKDRIVFINTGFLDRTGDELHTSMHAGPMVRKAQMRSAAWIAAYEQRNVTIGLNCGLSGRAQIGKGMWPAPDRMADMLEQKIAHPRTGANTAWVPSPTAATLHALHYHMVDVFAVRQELAATMIAPSLDGLLTIPLARSVNWTPQDIREELNNNAQGILGYVVRWIDQGIGCSKVPDIHDIGLMEDRATLRISSQHMANWLVHGVCSAEEAEAALLRMAAKVDAQNADDPLYKPMAVAPDSSLAFTAAKALVFEGAAQPNGYTEPLLHVFRARVKAAVC